MLISSYMDHPPCAQYLICLYTLMTLQSNHTKCCTFAYYTLAYYCTTVTLQMHSLSRWPELWQALG